MDKMKEIEAAFWHHFDKEKGIRLDIGCGEGKQKNFVGMDKRRLPGVDIAHDIQDFPWPIPDNACIVCLMSHLYEHIEPKYRIQLFDEIWRVLKPDGQLWLSSPYYLSIGANQDPTHYPCPNEATALYFAPTHPLYQVYKPKPWRIISNNYQMNGNLEVIMEAIKDEKGQLAAKAEEVQS